MNITRLESIDMASDSEDDVWNKNVPRKKRTKFVEGKEDQLMSIRDLSEKKFALTCLRCGRVVAWIRIACVDTKNLHIIDVLCRGCKNEESGKKSDKHVEDKAQSKFGDGDFNWQNDE